MNFNKQKVHPNNSETLFPLFTIERFNLMDERSVAEFTDGSLSTIESLDDDEELLMAVLHIDSAEQSGVYNLKIIPTYNTDLTSTFYDAIVKLDYHKPEGFHRMQRNGLFVFILICLFVFK